MDPPRVDSLGGEFAGAKAELKLHRGASEAEMEVIRRRIDQLEKLIDATAVGGQPREHRDE